MIQNPSRDVTNELEILVELILGMRVSLSEHVDGAGNIVVRAVARRPGWEPISHFWAALVEHSFHRLHQWLSNVSLTCNSLESLLLAWLILDVLLSSRGLLSFPFFVGSTGTSSGLL